MIYNKKQRKTIKQTEIYVHSLIQAIFKLT